MQINSSSISFPGKFLITGAAGELGREVVLFFLQKKVEVIPLVQDEKGILFLKEYLKPFGFETLPILAWDLSDAKLVKREIQNQTQTGEKIAGLFHCVGGFRMGRVEETLEEDFTFLWNANFKSAWNLLHELLPHFKANEYGKIIMISAKKAMESPSLSSMAAYLSSKRALNSLIESVAEDLREQQRRGITINAICPSIIDTSTNRINMPKENFQKWVSCNSIIDKACELMLDPTQNGVFLSLG